MSSFNESKICPICGDELPLDNFQVADVWKSNRKQRMLVCRHCANKQQRKKTWKNARDEFVRMKGLDAHSGKKVK